MNEDTAPDITNLVDLLNRLAEPPEPDPVSLMPTTWGWWVVAALLALALASLFWRWLAHHRANAYRRTALLELDDHRDDPAAIADLLRRTALAAWPRNEVAGLIGGDWIAFLNRTGGFPRDLGPALLAAPYRGESAPGDRRLGDAAAAWIRQHRREPAR